MRSMCCFTEEGHVIHARQHRCNNLGTLFLRSHAIYHQTGMLRDGAQQGLNRGGHVHHRASHQGPGRLNAVVHRPRPEGRGGRSPSTYRLQIPGSRRNALVPPVAATRPLLSRKPGRLQPGFLALLLGVPAWIPRHPAHVLPHASVRPRGRRRRDGALADQEARRPRHPPT